jgi:hypothetical protein
MVHGIWILYLKLQRKKFAVYPLDGDLTWPKYFPTDRYKNAENRNTTGSRLVGTLGKIIVCCPFEPMLFKRFLGLGQSWRIFLRACVQIAYSYVRNYFSYGNLILL